MSNDEKRTKLEKLVASIGGVDALIDILEARQEIVDDFLFIKEVVDSSVDDEFKVLAIKMILASRFGDSNEYLL